MLFYYHYWQPAVFDFPTIKTTELSFIQMNNGIGYFLKTTTTKKQQNKHTHKKEKKKKEKKRFMHLHC